VIRTLELQEACLECFATMELTENDAKLSTRDSEDYGTSKYEECLWFTTTS